MPEWKEVLAVCFCALICLGLFAIMGGCALYNWVNEREHVTARMGNMTQVDKCIYVCMTEGSSQNGDRKGCLEKCENNYLERLRSNADKN